MNWFRTSFLGLSVVFAGVPAFAQETAPVGLGQPTRLLADAAAQPVAHAPRRAIPVVNTAWSAPVEGVVPTIRQASHSAFPPPTVVRGARDLLEDDPHNLFLPRDLAPPIEPRQPPPMLPIPTARSPKPAVPALPIPAGMTFFRVDKNVQIDVRPDAPEMMLPPVVEAPTGTIVPIRHHDERIIFVDENGNPLFENRPAANWYGQAEWLLWWTKGFGLPPLITTADPADVAASGGGAGRTLAALGYGSTRLLFGNENTPFHARSGGRFTLGCCLDACGYDALEATFFFLGAKRGGFIADSGRFPVLGRPFFNINTNDSDRELVASPVLVGGVFRANGSIQVDTSTRLWGIEANLRRQLNSDACARVTGLVGFRYLDLSEQLGITERIEPLNAIQAGQNFVGVNVGDRITIVDSFNTRNRFYGGQLGLCAEWQRGRWTIDSRLKIALGANTQIVDIDGRQTIVATNGARQSFVGGLYALDSNSGRRSQVRFSAVPEVGCKLGYDLTDNCRIYAGYDFLYWGNVLRPGDQIDQQLDANKIPNSGAPDVAATRVRPVVPFRTTTFWAQGVSAGLEIRY